MVTLCRGEPIVYANMTGGVEMGALRSKPYVKNRKTSGGCSHSVQMVVMGVHAKELAS